MFCSKKGLCLLLCSLFFPFLFFSCFMFFDLFSIYFSFVCVCSSYQTYVQGRLENAKASILFFHFSKRNRGDIAVHSSSSGVVLPYFSSFLVYSSRKVVVHPAPFGRCCFPPSPVFGGAALDSTILLWWWCCFLLHPLERYCSASFIILVVLFFFSVSLLLGVLLNLLLLVVPPFPSPLGGDVVLLWVLLPFPH